LVKPNIDELQSTLGREFKNKEDLLAGWRELLDRGAKKVLLSLGKDGAVITDGTKNYYCRSINVAVNSTVGAGDSFTGSLGALIDEGYSVEDALRVCSAVGALAVQKSGAIPSMPIL